MLDQDENWWRRPAGVREVLMMALPLVVSNLSATIMIFTDRVFLAHYSTDAVAAALPAGNLIFLAICFPLGVASYVNTFVAQYHGANRPERIGLVVWQAVILGLATVPLMLLTIPWAPAIIHWAGHPREVAVLEVEFYQSLCWGESALVLAAALSGFFTGRGDTRTVMIVDSLAAGLNVLLDYAWIFGHFGFPECGVSGAGWATSTATLFRVLVYVALWLRPAFRARYQTLAGCRFDRELFGRLLWFGSPNGVQYLIEVGAFCVFIVLVGQIGKNELAASNLAFNLNALVFMPVLGIGVATSALVGRHLGENRPDLAARSTWTALWLAVVVLLPLAALYVLFPDVLLWAYGNADGATPDTMPRDTVPRDTVPRDTVPRELAAVLLRFVAFYSLFDAMNVIFAGAIKGAGDTRFAMLTTVSAAVGAGILIWASQEWFHLGLHGAWFCVTGWICILGVVFLLRFMQGRWREMRVIESAADAGS
ncbi:MAG TPA: MATE family efflux transporter [Pirellulales bacterium]|nr:MATE family efflux transporter [Pirellulales bacterium]